MRILGAIVAGGTSRRFGGDKAAALLDGKPLIDHVADGLRPQVETLVVVGRSWPGLVSLDDRPAGRLGPLAGLNAALHHAGTLGIDGVLSAGCDTLPILPDLAARLAGADPAYVAGHFLLGWWPARLAALLDTHLEQTDDRSMRGWIAKCDAMAVSLPVTLYNLNTSGDLRDYERITAS